jgi:hypothetical protein
MSEDNVTPIRPGVYDPTLISDDVLIEPDRVLEANKGTAKQLVLVMVEHSGKLSVAGSHSAAESHMLLHLGMLELAKHGSVGLFEAEE